MIETKDDLAEGFRFLWVFLALLQLVFSLLLKWLWRHANNIIQMKQKGFFGDLKQIFTRKEELGILFLNFHRPWLVNLSIGHNIR